MTVRISKKLLAGLGAAVLVVVVFLAVKAIVDDDGGTSGNESDQNFALKYPSQWQPLAKDKLAKYPGSPLLVLRREDGKGIIVVQREQQPPSNLAQFSNELTRELEKRVPDFEKRSATTIKTRAGKAFYYSYIRKDKGTVHSVLVVPAGSRTYVVNSVSPGGQNAVARQIGAILQSFELTG